MDVILVKDVDTLGKEGTVVHVKPGYARNYLIPRGLALSATPEHQRMLEARQRHAAAKQVRLRQQAEQLKQKLESRSLTIALKLGEGDKPFGSVTVHDLVEQLEREGITIEKPAIQLAPPLKTLGIFDVPVRLHPEVTATLKVWVVKG